MISKVYKEDDNRPKLLEDEFRQIGVDFDGAHDASADIHATAKCFWEMRKKRLI